MIKHEEKLIKGYTIDCNYVIRIKDYFRIIPLITVDTGLWEL